MSIRSILDSKGWGARTIDGQASVYDAVDLMSRDRIGSLVVREGSNLGILTERDILTRVLLARRDASTTPVRDVMTIDVAFVDVEVEIGDVMELMTRRRCRHLPVVDGARGLVGLLSIGDVVAWINRGLDLEVRDFTAYVCGPGAQLR